MSKCGIVGYGAYIPIYRITTKEIAEVNNASAEAIEKGLGIIEKSVPAKDEDTATISVAAARNAMQRAKINPKEIGAVYVGSESHPYAVKTTSGIIGEAIGAGPDYMAADLEFACKAGTAGLQMCMGLVESNRIEYGLAIGADTSQGAPGDALEYSAAAGGAAYIIGKKKDEILAEIDDTLSYTTDTPDFWRRGKADYPTHAGRFTGEPAYFKHVIEASKRMMEKTNTKPKDFQYAVFHQPNGKFPLKAMKTLGFTHEQIKPGLVVTNVGNTYSGSSMLGLSNVLDKAKDNEKILVTSYGSGAGSDSFVLTTTKNLEKAKERARKTIQYVSRKKYLNYSHYRRHMEQVL